MRVLMMTVYDMTLPMSPSLCHQYFFQRRSCGSCSSSEQFGSTPAWTKMCVIDVHQRQIARIHFKCSSGTTIPPPARSLFILPVRD